MMKKEPEIEKIYSLSPMQSGMLFHYLMNRESNVYFEQFVLTIRGKLDTELFQESLNLITKTYDTLRTAFVFEKIRNPKQIVFKEREIKIHYQDISSLTEDKQEQFLNDYKSKDREKNIDLTRDLLMRFAVFKTGEDLYKLVWSFHHIILDGWCSGIIFKKLAQYYYTLKNKRPAVPDKVTPYGNYIEWLEKQNKKIGLEYWQEYLSGYEKKAGLPAFKKTLKNEGGYDLQEYEIKINRDFTGYVENFARKNKITVNTILQTLWGILLSRYNHTHDVVFGSVVSGRPPEIPGIEDMVGLFVNTVPIRLKIEGNISFSEILGKVHEQSILSKSCEYLQLAEIQANSNLEGDLIDHIIAFENYPFEKELNDVSTGKELGFVIENVEAYEQTNYDFDIIIVPGKEYLFKFRFNSVVHEFDFIRNVATNFINLLEKLIKNPGSDITGVDILNSEERKEILYNFNKSESLFPGDKTLPAWFSQQVGKTPDSIAVIFGDEFLSYRYLDERSNQIACYLHSENGIRADICAAVLMERSAYLMEAIWGILKAGGAYIPLETNFPGERLKELINDAGIEAVISRKKFIKILNRLQWECECLRTYICLDSSAIYNEEETGKNELMAEKLWNYIGESSTDEITGGGWQSSYTGEPFTKEEMREYGENILEKLSPLLHKDMKILEIGCASGISMYRLAPHVALYFGTDISGTIIENNKRRIKEEGHQNIRLSCLPAHEIDKLEERNFDIIIMNSVIHCFHGHHYLRRVIKKAIDLLGSTGYLYIGDIMDQQLKQDLTRDMIRFKQAHQDKNYRTKIDWSAELFVSRGFFEDLKAAIPGIENIEYSNKIYTIENELTKYRYDSLIKIDKTRKKKKEKPQKKKFQHDQTVLDRYGKERVTFALTPGNSAYVIYTSGSTGKPKGVMMEHRPVVNRLNWMQTYYAVSEADVLIQKTSISFDVSVWELFWGTFHGAPLYLLSPGGEKEPEEIIDSIEKNRISTIHFVPSMLKVFLEHVETGNCIHKLSSLRQVFASGEALGPEQVETFNRLLFEKNKTRLINLYGPTEAAIDVSYFNCSIRKTLECIPIGKPIANITLLIMDDRGHLQPIGAPGELCISGIGLARGYLNQPTLTAGKFIPNPFKDRERLYRTGDVARWLPDGNIEFLGRKDRQVKMRGFRIELGEIHIQLIKNPAIKDAVVLAKEDGTGNRYLCAYYTSDTAADASDLGKFLGRTLPGYMIPAYFVHLEKLPLTVSGKIDSKALPDPRAGIQLEKSYRAPGNNIEENMVKVWQEVLGIKRIGTEDNFFRMGGDSIKAIQVSSRLQKYGLKLEIGDLFSYPRVKELSAHVKRITPEPDHSITKREPGSTAGGYFPLTDVQMAYLLGRNQTFEMGGISTHGYRDFKTKLDMQRLNRALDQLIKRHPMLRAIISEDGQQRILEEVTGYKIEIEDISHLEADSQKERILRERERMSDDIFKPDRWPLFEIKALKLSDNIHHLFLGLDILIADALSIEIIKRELTDFYENPGLELPAIEFTFSDYVLAYRDFRNSGKYKEDKEYWLSKLEEFPSAPSLPLKCDPSRVKKPHFKCLKKVLPETGWNKLKEIARENNITASALICTAYAEVLAFFSNQSRLAVNLTIFNRYPFHKDVDKIVGDFTSILLLGLDFEKTNTFRDKAGLLQETLWEALEHRHFDGVSFIREISKHRKTLTKAIMPIVFTSTLFQERAQFSGDKKRLLEYDSENRDELQGMSISQTSQVFIDSLATERNNRLELAWDYVDELFEATVIESMFQQYLDILDNLIEKGADYIPRVTGADRLFIEDYNNTGEEIKPTTLHYLFKKQVERVPFKAAVETREEVLTYKELDKRSNRVACYLRGQGIDRGDLIGLSAQRSIDTIVHVMGILKAGAAYVPVDPEYPPARKDYIIKNSNCKLFLEPGSYFSRNIHRCPDREIEDINCPGDVGYVIYTSGSTGRPKGVIITHQAVTNTIIDINRKFSVDKQDRIIGISSLCFDLSVYDIFGALSAGALLVIAADQRDIMNLIRTVYRHRVTIWNSVPAIMDLAVKKLGPGIVESLFPGLSIKEGDINHPFDDEKTKYYWSPAVYWKKESDAIKIGKYFYAGIALELFPGIYFFSQEGISLPGLLQKFPGVDPGKLKGFIIELVKKRILIKSVLRPDELFKSQDKLLREKYDEEILYSVEAYNKFKYEQVNRRYDAYNTAKIELDGGVDFPAFISSRRSYREFDREKPVPFDVFSRLLATFKQTRDHDNIYYNYASGGGLYPIDIFVYVKKNRVENLPGGLYYYAPVDNSLREVEPGEIITEKAHSPGNRPIFNASAVTIFMIYNAETNMPKYGGMGYFFAAIDAGIMAATLTQVAELSGIGLCSIGNMNFSKIENYFRLNDNQVFIHAIELGLIPGKSQKTAIDVAEAVMLESRHTLEKEIDAGYTRNRSLRLVLLSGDWIPLELPDKIKKHFPNSGVISLGGATEASIWSIHYPVKNTDQNWKSIPYGYPLANQEFYVLNYEQRLCPPEVPGELYIGGTGVASGYINDKDKTSRAFINHPRLGYLYRTGDYGILHRSGYIEFLGRKDLQVKIRGHRIELEEIEYQLIKHPDIGGVVVTVRTGEDKNGDKYLCAYFTSKKQLTSSQLRDYSARELSYYMIPGIFIQLDKIPLTANGKIDRKSLPAPKKNTVKEKKVSVVLSSDIEKIIAEICKEEVPELDDLGINDNFFEIGIDSLQIAGINRRLKEKFKIDIPLINMFEYPTIGSFSQFLTREKLGKKIPAITLKAEGRSRQKLRTRKRRG